jgi:glycosyltransferase involved in cell wall biosynthesis
VRSLQRNFQGALAATNHIPFSVIMPFYKADKPEHVSDAIESLFTQSLRADEVVLIQDGPVTEALIEMVEQWKKKMPEINHVILEQNQGLSAALNAGIKAAKHEWLARMDADDICEPERFEEQLALIHQQPDLAIQGSWITEFDEDMQREIAVRKLPETHDEILKYAKWRCPFNHMTVMYRKSAIDKLGAYKNYGAVGDDYELWARFLVNGHKSANIQRSLVKARTGTDFYNKRRRGWKYFKNEVREVNDLYRLGLIGPLLWLFHVSIKAVVRFSPPFVVKFIYKGIRKTS